MNATAVITHLQLRPHPEGGFYKEIYRSEGAIAAEALPSTFGGERSFSTTIYYLLQRGDFSAFHRIKSDECWHFYAGRTLLIHCLSQERGYTCLRLGSNLEAGDSFYQMVASGVWFAAEPAPETEYALTGCTVSPGFDFRDFQMATKAELLQQFPTEPKLINRLCR